MIKFSLIMPTYNDAISIVETLDSIISQTYKNWELIIIDDGSQDNTKEVIKNYKKKYDKENKISYYCQENADQLNAILNACDKITGEYIYIIHSDDLFANENILSYVVKELENNEEYDAFLSKGSYIIDKASNITGKQKFLTYKNKNYVIPLQLLWLGRNLYWDFAFFKKEVFLTEVKNNYLTWNMPFWLNTESEPYILKVKTIDFFFIKYRVFEGNYINNEIGKLNVINGELRTATRLLKYYTIPFYRFQYLIFRCFNKINLLSIYRPIYFKKESKNEDKIIKYIIKKRYKEGYEKYEFLDSLIKFYEKENNRTIYIKNISNHEKIFTGADMRKFNKMMLEGKLSKLYLNLLEEMSNGFSRIVTTKKDYKKVITLTKFLCIYPFVTIETEGKEQ